MKITKQQLYNITKEEFAAVLEQDAQGMFARGAKGAGADEISVEKIRIAPDGSFKARLSSASLEKPSESLAGWTTTAVQNSAREVHWRLPQWTPLERKLWVL